MGIRLKIEMSIFIIIYLLLLSYFDWKEKAVPMSLLWIGGLEAILILGYRIATMTGETEAVSASVQTIVYGLMAYLPALLPGSIFLLLACITKKVGIADGIVFCMLGILLGYKQIMMLFGCSLLLLCFYAGGMLLMRKGNLHSKIAYLPFVALSYLLMLPR